MRKRQTVHRMGLNSLTIIQLVYYYPQYNKNDNFTSKYNNYKQILTKQNKITKRDHLSLCFSLFRLIESLKSARKYAAQLQHI